jgi:hypothetical protein
MPHGGSTDLEQLLPLDRRRTVAGGDRVVEERRIEREF